MFSSFPLPHLVLGILCLTAMTVCHLEESNYPQIPCNSHYSFCNCCKCFILSGESADETCNYVLINQGAISCVLDRIRNRSKPLIRTSPAEFRG